MTTFTALIALALAATPLLAPAQQVYRWVGPDGVVQYSEHPPAGIDAEPVSVRTGPMAGGNADAAPGTTAGPPASPQPASPPQAAPPPPQPSPEQQAERERQRAENCRLAKENLRVLETARRVMGQDPQGNPIRLDDDQRQARLAETRQQIEKYCEPER
jgi:hypothetical protein